MVLHAADLRTVGHRAVLADADNWQRAELSAAALGLGAAPPHGPLELIADGGGLSIRAHRQAEYLLQGQPGTGAEALSREQLDRGVVVDFDGLLVLLGWFSRRDRPPPLHGLFGGSDAIERVRAEITAVAGLDVAVLVRGETGTGKERVARAIHAASARSHRPFVAVNMAAIAPSAAASELFGHRRGAFTDAVAHHDGFFGSADHGTLFLDEIGETPGGVQSLLLRALDEGQIQPVGGTPRRADVRLIAATDADLELDVQEGRFREALLHRIAVCTIEVPPLRRRREEIAVLLVHFLREQLQQMGSEHLLDPPVQHSPWLPKAVVAELLAYEWPGNVRQLRNVAIEMAVKCSRSPAALVPPTLYRTRRARRRPASGPYVPDAHADARRPVPTPTDVASMMAAAQMPSAERPALARTDRERPALIPDAAIAEALAHCGYNVTAAARALGIAKNTLAARMARMPQVRRSTELSRREFDEALVATHGDLTAAADLLGVSPRALSHRLAQLPHDN